MSPSIVGHIVSRFVELDNSERPEAEVMAISIGTVAFIGEYTILLSRMEGGKLITHCPRAAAGSDTVSNFPSCVVLITDAIIEDILNSPRGPCRALPLPSRHEESSSRARRRRWRGPPTSF